MVAVVALLSRRKKERERRERLQDRFGGEYDRAVAGGDTRAAEARLAQAEKERDRLDVRPLTAESRRRRTAQWQAVQADFVEVPVETVDAAAELVREVMTERGYPGEGDERALTLLAADHADTVEHYRAAEAHRSRFSSGEGSTEDLRRAFVEYRRLFDVLVQEGADRTDPADDSAFVDGSVRPDGSPMTADDYVREQQGVRGGTAGEVRETPRGEHQASDPVRDDGPAAEDRTLGDRLDRLRREDPEALEAVAAGRPARGPPRGRRARRARRARPRAGRHPGDRRGHPHRRGALTRWL